ncbi:MAG TPA: exodeoxyribonuclease VII small subunit [Firmicutes bacterium]|nr:exodeoxyribonuclease VII small subunit [Bacillota bacterium]
MEQGTEKLNFDEALAQLENVVRQLEMGNLPLETAIDLYKKGMSLSNDCHQKLQQIEQEVATLVEPTGAMKDFSLTEE